MTALLVSIGAGLLAAATFAVKWLLAKNSETKAKADAALKQKDLEASQANLEDVTKKFQKNAADTVEDLAKRDQAAADLRKQTQELRNQLDDKATAEDVVKRINEHFKDGGK